jgi:hypothetical protein
MERTNVSPRLPPANGVLHTRNDTLRREQLLYAVEQL